MLDDLPEMIPITVRELDTIQISLGDLIDQLPTGTAPDALTQPISIPRAEGPSGLPSLDRA